jgi:hypothetical protein
MLYMPIKWTFTLVEATLVSVIHTIRTLFRWTGVAIWFAFQITLYGTVEYMMTLVLGIFDVLILSAMPTWTPRFIVAGTGTVIGVAASKSYWYGISFWECMKWNFGARIGLWAIWMVIGGGFKYYGEWRDRVKRRH